MGSSQSQCSALQCKVWLPHQCVVRKGPGVPLGSASRPPTNHSYSKLVIETMSWERYGGRPCPTYSVDGLSKSVERQGEIPQ